MLIDIRQLHERASGQAEGALAIAQNALETEPATHLPEHAREIVLICQRGKRSAHTAAILRAHGYARVASVAGGTSAGRATACRWCAPRCRRMSRIF